MHDAMSAGEATPQEIYDVIKGVVEENYYTYKHQASQAYELLALLNGNGKGHLTCDKDDSSPECKGAWNNFWGEEVNDDCMPPWGHSDLEYLCKNNNKNEIWESGQITDELMETIKHEGYDYTPIPSKKKWTLPVEEVENGDTMETEYFITFPDDLLEAANLKPGDDVEWVDRNDGSFLLRKIEKTLNHDEAIAAGWTMTDDGFWIKE
jgi:hypothetical protein